MLFDNFSYDDTGVVKVMPIGVGPRKVPFFFVFFSLDFFMSLHHLASNCYGSAKRGNGVKECAICLFFFAGGSRCELNFLLSPPKRSVAVAE